MKRLINESPRTTKAFMDICTIRFRLRVISRHTPLVWRDSTASFGKAEVTETPSSGGKDHSCDMRRHALIPAESCREYWQASHEPQAVGVQEAQARCLRTARRMRALRMRALRMRALRTPALQMRAPQMQGLQTLALQTNGRNCTSN